MIVSVIWQLLNSQWCVSTFSPTDDVNGQVAPSQQLMARNYEVT